MTALDILVLVLVGGGAFRGFRNGFVAEVLSLAAWVAGIAALKAAHEPVTAALTDSVGSPSGAAALAFVLVFFGVFLLVRLIANRLGGATRRSVVGPFDRVLGGGFGGLKGLLSATLIFLGVTLVIDFASRGGDRPTWIRDARSYPLLQASSRAITDLYQQRRRPRIAQ